MGRNNDKVIYQRFGHDRRLMAGMKNLKNDDISVH